MNTISIICFYSGLVEEGKIDGETVKQTTSKGSNKNNIEEEVELVS